MPKSTPPIPTSLSINDQTKLLLEIEDRLKKAEDQKATVPVLVDWLHNPTQEYPSSPALHYLKKIAAYDGDKKTLSLFDVTLQLAHLSLTDAPLFLQVQDSKDNSATLFERLHLLSEPLWDTSTNTIAQNNSILFFKLLKEYEGLPAPVAGALRVYADSVLSSSPAESIFQQYFEINWENFLILAPKQKGQIITNAVEKKLPDINELQQIIPLLSRTEYVGLTILCFKKDSQQALTLFEVAPYPYDEASENFNRREIGELYLYWPDNPMQLNPSTYFTNLTPDTEYQTRTNLIDTFLENPTSETTNSAQVNLKKYTWPGNTEVFVLDSGQPGPVTLVVAPHFHEQNPRKSFHWMKDLPLKSGRVIFIPEANRGMADIHGDTNPMNAIFESSLTASRIDYLIVRRIQRLMGLTDNFIGLHDSQGGPFFISDDGLNPQTNPWMPETTTNFSENSVHWQAAYRALKIMESMEGIKQYYTTGRYAGRKLHDENTFSFIATKPSGATGYMNENLNKPAMTFEGAKGKEHGQLLAAAQYALLKALGHNIDSEFETTLENAPTIDRELYEGLTPN